MSHQSSFDKDVYQKTKPYLHSALEHIVAMGKDVQDFVEFSMDKFGDAALPYLDRFLKELHEGEIKVKGLTRGKLERIMSAHVTPEQREQMIREEAYLRAEQRWFQGGSPLDDWLEAERDVDSRIAEQAGLVARGREIMNSIGDVVESEYKEIKAVVNTWFGLGNQTGAKEESQSAVKKPAVKKKAIKKTAASKKASPKPAAAAVEEKADKPAKDKVAQVKKAAAAKKVVKKKAGKKKN